MIKKISNPNPANNLTVTVSCLDEDRFSFVANSETVLEGIFQLLQINSN